jgi:hypothetical protein
MRLSVGPRRAIAAGSAFLLNDVRISAVFLQQAQAIGCGACNGAGCDRSHRPLVCRPAYSGQDGLHGIRYRV